MTKLFFIRHAKSDHTNEDDFYRPLTAEGVMVAKRIPELFRDTKIDYFYSSPYIRSVETIKYLANKFKRKITARPGLQERRIGVWLDDFFEYTEKQWEDFDYKIDNGESLSEVQRRNLKEVEFILKKHQNQNIVIGTHGTALCTILNHLDSKYNYDYFLSIAKKMPLIIETEFEGLECVSIKELDIGHL